MRTAVGEEELETILHNRRQMNEVIQNSVQAAATNWGIKILHCEINFVKPADSILEAMNQKISNEIETKKQVSPLPALLSPLQCLSLQCLSPPPKELQIVWLKKKSEIEAETKKILASAESESELIKVRNQMLGQKERILQEVTSSSLSLSLSLRSVSVLTSLSFFLSIG
jgi:regulator of protease activity HflC (stomatin/prohibitin superfamily)